MNQLHFESIDSTNNYLKQHYKELKNFTFVSADYQTNGKGRNEREWKSENGKNLLFSLLLLDKQLFNHYKELSIITAYSIIKVLENIGIKDLKIKWPNDVYANNKKIAGILLESVSTGDIECIIVGIGINVNQNIFDGEYRVEPTSIYEQIKKECDIEKLKENIYKTLINNIESLKTNNNIFHLIESYDYLKGKEAYAQINNSKEKINIIGIQEDLSLLIEYNNKLININSGEIENINTVNFDKI